MAADRPGFRTVVLEWVPNSPVPWDAERQIPRLLGNRGGIDVPFRQLRWIAATPPVRPPGWIQPVGRTVILIGLLAGGVWWSRRYGDAAWPEWLAVLGGVGWVAAGDWYWLLPVAAGVMA